MTRKPSYRIELGELLDSSEFHLTCSYPLPDGFVFSASGAGAAVGDQRVRVQLRYAVLLLDAGAAPLRAVAGLGDCAARGGVRRWVERFHPTGRHAGAPGMVPRSI